MAADEWVVVRLQMQNANQFIAQARLAGASIGSISKGADAANRSLDRAANRGFWFSQAMFTIRRSIYHTTQALGVLAAGVVFIGVKFNAMMEQQRLAFSRFMGSTAAANKEISFLFNLAAKTPFEFQQVVQATRQLMAFGFTARATNSILKDLADAVAAMGLGQDALDRATLALGQIRSSGRLLGQDLRQLMQLGLIDPNFLRKRFNLTPEQMGNIGKAMIPSEQAIDAIQDYWRLRFSGSAKAFQHTLIGAWSTFKDYASFTAGEMMKPLTNYLTTTTLPMLSKMAKQARPAFKQEGVAGVIGLVDTQVQKSTGFNLNLAHSYRVVRDFVIALAGALYPLIKAVIIFFHVFQPTIRVLQVLTPILRVLGWVLTKLQIPLTIVISWLLLERIALLAASAATKVKIGWDIVHAWWLRRKAIAMSIATGAQVTNTGATRIATLWSMRNVAAGNLETVMYNRKIAATRMNIIMLALMRRAYIIGAAVSAVYTAAGGGIAGVLAVLKWGFIGAARAVMGFTIALLTNPFVLIGLAVIALVVGLVILYKKWDWFHDKVQALFNFIRHNWQYLGGPMLAPFLLTVRWVIDHFDAIKEKVGAVLDWIRDKLNWIGDKFKWVGNILGGGGGGGIVLNPLATPTGGLTAAPLGPPGSLGGPLGGRGGRAAPRRPAVSPVSAGQLLPMTMPKGKYVEHLTVESPVKLDRRELGRAVARLNLDEEARR